MHKFQVEKSFENKIYDTESERVIMYMYSYSFSATMSSFFFDYYPIAVADPRIPVGGGRAPVREGVDLRHGHFSVKMYAKMKELGPIGGRAPGTLPPRSTNEL